MKRPRVLRPLAAAAALATAILAPSAAPAGPPRPVLDPLTTHQTLEGRALLYGTLAALHPATHTGDLALPDGTLLPLRFTLAAQLQGLRVGDELAVDVEGHGHARLLVRMVEHGDFSKHWRGAPLSKHWRDQDFSKHWRVQDFSKHWRAGDYSKHWRIHGVVARTMGHGDAEVLGVDGAAAMVRLGTAGVGGTAGVPSSSAAYAQGLAALTMGQEVDVQVTPLGDAVVAATAIQIVGQAPGMDVEGIVSNVDAASGTVTLTDENGQCARVVLGARAAAYSAGQTVEAWGRPRDWNSAGTVLDLVSDTTAEHEDGASTRPTQGRSDRNGTPTPTPTAAFVIPVLTATTPAMPTPAFAIPVDSPTATTTDTAVPAPTSTATTTPPATSTASGTATTAPMATGVGTSTPTGTAASAAIATPTATSEPTGTDTPTETALPAIKPTKTCHDGDRGGATAGDDCD